MTHKEFYIWLDGFMTNREWTVIKEIDIETIQEKMKEVKDEQSESVKITPFERIPVPVNPLPKNDDPYKPPYEVYCGTKTQSND
jgi:hypothetical protein